MEKLIINYSLDLNLIEVYTCFTVPYNCICLFIDSDSVSDNMDLVTLFYFNIFITSIINFTLISK